MFYLDSQRTVTRRDSSLFNTKESDDVPYVRNFGISSVALASGESGISICDQPKYAVRDELVTWMFESMLDTIVESWQVIPQQQRSQPTVISPSTFDKTSSDTTLRPKKKASRNAPKHRKSRSKTDISAGHLQDEPQRQIWWNQPDEKAVIEFKNGNVYEGQISMKCMHGEGRFQWADGSVYFGHFRKNEIYGKGKIQWKDDTWYEGDFVGNLRHGKGVYVDSRRQRAYVGSWDCGTKHGQGVIYYSKCFKNLYDGEWIHNTRHGFGSREYCAMSGYKGEWNNYIREGKGLLMWPNHDFYRGEWKEGIMSGYGIYVWNIYYNNSMSLPTINCYRGFWVNGQREGYGVLNLGFGLGSHYKGEFKNNKKHGAGKFVTNGGLILTDRKLFVDDNLGTLTSGDKDESEASSDNRTVMQDPYNFDICDDYVGLFSHIHKALENIDKQDFVRADMVNEFLENNGETTQRLTNTVLENENTQYDIVGTNYEELIEFEEESLKKSLKCYGSDLKRIYFIYATICNKEQIHFTPLMIRLYLWQFYFDCKIHEKGLTFVQIDRIFHSNPDWLSRSPHNPFERIYFWQFVHSLIFVSSMLYAKHTLPGPKPDTIVANAFRMFMDHDVLPGVTVHKGKLVNNFGTFVPLKETYALYRSIGEPHTVRKFLCSARMSPHCLAHDLEVVEPPDDCVPLGHNAYVLGEEISYITDEPLPSECENYEEHRERLKLFNFCNLSSRTIINIFGKIFPQMCCGDRIMDLNIEITFFEFFEAFISCAEESIRVQNEETRPDRSLACSAEGGAIGY